MPVWRARTVEPETVRRLASEMVISPLKARILAVCGIRGADQAARYLFPSFSYLHDPFEFNEMKRAVYAINRAIQEGQRILIHGDYDADGICGTALLYNALKKMGADVHYFIPNREKDGYGLARRVMERGMKVGLGMVISVDCGSSDREVVSCLRDGGVSVIITDHHEIGQRVPEATAFINPKLNSENYPYQNLAGVGVAFKLLQGLEKQMGLDLDLERMLDIVAIGTLGDYVDLDGENRILVKLGMEVLKEWNRPGLEALREISGLDRDSSSARRICYSIIPRLNSTGRISSAREAVELLSTHDVDEAGRIARKIEEKNRQRKNHDSVVTEEASYLADITIKRGDPAALVFSSSSWHEGVVGIGASRLAEQYNRVAALIAVKEKLGKGSVRSPGGINIKEVLDRCSNYLMEFGGHKEAGGFTISVEDIPEFQMFFEQIVTELAGDEGIRERSMIFDGELNLSECTLDLVSFMEGLEPFGPRNPEPVFLIRSLEALPGSREVGKGHLKLVVAHPGGGGCDMIGFSLAERWSPRRLTGKWIDIVGHLRRNCYRGIEKPQIEIRDIRYSEG